MTSKDDKHAHYIEIWAKAVDTQMHFNEMSVKSRQIGLTFVAAVLGVAVVLISKSEDFTFYVGEGPYFEVHVAVLLILGALIALYAVRELDLNVYHKMLRGAVTFGEDFEQNYMKEIFDLEKGMTQAISHFSRFEDAGKAMASESTKFKYSGKKQVTAEDKIRKFYRNTFITLGAAAIAMFIATNVNTWWPSDSEDETPSVEEEIVRPTK